MSVDDGPTTREVRSLEPLLNDERLAAKRSTCWLA